MITPMDDINNRAYQRLKSEIDTKYPHGRFVAIDAGLIVADAPTFEELDAILDGMGKTSPDVFVVQSGEDIPDYGHSLSPELQRDSMEDADERRFAEAVALNHRAYEKLKPTIDRSYPHLQFIAIDEGRIVADAADFRTLHEQLTAAGRTSRSIVVIQAGAEYLEYGIIL